jgi:aspartyl-tRNA(Asn)/glutamyl-tRNA(Gln) amidotransferase subunit C
MTDPITPDVFNHLVELGALELDASQSEYLRAELNHQLKAIHELEAIPLDASIPPALHGTPYPKEVSPEPRADEWQLCPNPEEILSQAPEVENGYIIVPEIPHTQLD